MYTYDLKAKEGVFGPKHLSVLGVLEDLQDLYSKIKSMDEINGDSWIREVWKESHTFLKFGRKNLMILRIELGYQAFEMGKVKKSGQVPYL